MRRLGSRLLAIAPEETSVRRRGFRGDDLRVHERLELIGRTFLDGYHAALDDDRGEALVSRLNAIDSERRGFAFEGAAMGLRLLDSLTPWNRRRWHAFVAGPGAAHVYMVHVGVGWVIARLPWLRWRIDRPLARLDPLLRWLAVDGYGFHEGFFGGPPVVERQVAARAQGYVRRAFDQGFGRSLWFVEGGDVDRIPITIGKFPRARQGDLWSGVGLACSYAGGVDDAALISLRAAAGSNRPELAQGAAFAATARLRAGNPAAHTTMACERLCGVPVATAARIVDGALEDLPVDGVEPAYEIWRRRIQAQLAREIGA